MFIEIEFWSTLLDYAHNKETLRTIINTNQIVEINYISLIMSNGHFFHLTDDSIQKVLKLVYKEEVQND